MRRSKLFTCITTLSMAAMLLAGCGDSAVESSNGATQETTAVETVAEESDECVVATSVAVVDILDALGVEMQGVPTSSYELPESVADATRIGNPMSPDMEIIKSLEPTVIVSVDSLSAELQEQFDILGAESVFASLSSYDGLKDSITLLGERFGKEDEADAILADFEERESAIEESIADKEAPEVLIIFGVESSFMVASEDSYVGDLVSKVGGVNIITDAPSSFSPIDMEYLAEKNPDYILFMAHANPEESLAAFEKEFETNEAWQNFDAVKNGNVCVLDTGYFGMSANLQAVDAMEKLIDILYEEN